MPNLVEVNYGRTGKSTNTDTLGIRLRQASARQVREMQARALMFLARSATGSEVRPIIKTERDPLDCAACHW